MNQTVTSASQLRPGDQLRFGQWHTVTRVVVETGLVDVRPEGSGKPGAFTFEQAEQLLNTGNARRPSFVDLTLVRTRAFDAEAQKTEE